MIIYLSCLEINVQKLIYNVRPKTIVTILIEIHVNTYIFLFQQLVITELHTL
jgi:hypothetical protein